MPNAKTLLITGGAQGIGLGIAKCFAREGWRVAIADKNPKLAKTSAKALLAEGAPDAAGIGCDITVRAQVESAVSGVLKRFGQIDLLVNNAGISPFVDVMDLSPELFDTVINVNLTGAFHCTQLVGRHMIERVEGGGPAGRVIFISSLAPQFSQPTQAEYSASKAGVEGLMRGFATRLGRHGITCNAIAPGMILTPLTEFHWAQPGPAEQIKQLVPLGRIGQPEDIGNAALMLASDRAAYINGAVIPVDGGFSILIKG